jgi:CheY-like chemotaxis protein
MRNDAVGLTQPLAFYFPGTILCIDDDSVFLDGLLLNFPSFFNLQIQSNPLIALDLLSGQGDSNRSSALVEPLDDSDSNEDLDCPVNIHISKIIDILYQTKRFSKITVTIVDQSMPEINGLDLCARVKGNPVKKIMLTGGESANTLAIDAFNKGLIDYFISKKDPHRMCYLQSAVSNLQQKYFQACSALILDAVCVQPASFLSSPLFLY